MTADYKVGDVITYRTFTGALRTVKVTHRYADVKNGRAGFSGKLLTEEKRIQIDADEMVWGYDSDIVEGGKQ